MNESSSVPNLILIGPGGTGKSTLAKLLGEALDRPFIDLDKVRNGYYAEIGYDRDEAQRIRQEQGFPALAAHWKPFEIYSVERLLQDYPTDHVIAFGAGQSVYDDAGFAERVRQALEPHHVVLLLPSPDVDRSLHILDARLHLLEPDLPDSFFDMIARFNRYFLEHPANPLLATITVYTDGKSPQQTRDEIIAALNLNA